MINTKKSSVMQEVMWDFPYKYLRQPNLEQPSVQEPPKRDFFFRSVEVHLLYRQNYVS